MTRSLLALQRILWFLYGMTYNLLCFDSPSRCFNCRFTWFTHSLRSSESYASVCFHFSKIWLVLAPWSWDTIAINICGIVSDVSSYLYHVLLLQVQYVSIFSIFKNFLKLYLILVSYLWQWRLMTVGDDECQTEMRRCHDGKQDGDSSMKDMSRLGGLYDNRCRLGPG